MSDFTDLGHFLFTLRQAKQQPKELKTLVFLRFLLNLRIRSVQAIFPESESGKFYGREWCCSSRFLHILSVYPYAWAVAYFNPRVLPEPAFLE